LLLSLTATNANNPDGGNYSNTPLTIIPAKCTLKAIYAALTPSNEWGLPVAPSISLTLWQNSGETDFPSCQVTAQTPIACTMPGTPISVSAGDTLSYVLNIPGASNNAVGILNTTLLCQ
jgi:hypothetical protein